MADKTAPKTIDEYIAGFPPDVQTVLTKVRSTIRRALPDAEEGISYGIPTYRRAGGYVIYFAGWKKHFSLYPVSTRLAATFKKELAPYDLSGRGTVRFLLSEPVPVKLISAIAKFRAREGAEARKKKTASTRVSRRG
jgi:uncharacterized protein YdhG (YjbR/CyaY superfamily)